MRQDLSLADTGKLLPSSVEAENQIIGVLLAHGEKILPKIPFLKESDFFFPTTRDIFAAILLTSDKGEAITPFTVRHYLREPEVFKEVNGFSQYAARLISFSQSTYEPIGVAEYIRELSYKRHLVHLCETTIERMCRENDPDSGAHHAGELREGIEKISENTQLDLFLDNHEVIERVMKNLHRDEKCYSTGINKLDKAMDGGLYPGKSYGFCARKKVGKTVIAATLSANLNLAGVSHLFICGEMSPEEIQQRIISRYTQTFPSAFRTKYGRSDEFNDKLQSALAQMPRNTFYHHAPGISFTNLRRVVQIAIERKRVKGFILDYWQLVRGKQKGQSTSEHLDEVAQWVADYSRKKGVFAIMTAQTNQDGNTRGSEGIRLAFDQVYELVRKNLGEGESSLDMIETRYTPWANIPDLWMNLQGPYFEVRDELVEEITN